MKHITAIFRKDARRLWPQIAVFWAMLVLGVLCDPGRTERSLSPYRMFLMLLSLAQPLACWTLLIAAIHEECLPGDRQYWLTRPFTWKSLLLEKLLFTAMFVNLALFVAQSAILLRVGISPLAHLPALLWTQVFFSVMFVLPVAAFAAVTRNLGQVILAAFLVFVPFFGLLQLRMFAQPQNSWANLDWMRTLFNSLIVAAGVAAVLMLQYSRRRTVLSRAMIGMTAGAMILSGFMPRAWGLSIRSLWSAASELRIGVTLLDPARAVPNIYPGVEGSVNFEIPVRFDGLPGGAEVIPERFSARIEVPGSSSVSAFANRFTVGTTGQGQLSIYVSRGVYDVIKGKTAHLAGTMEFALMRNRQSFPAPGRGGEVVPGVGVCFQSVGGGLIGPPRMNIACSTPFPRVAVYLAGEVGRPNWLIPPGSVSAPIPTDKGFDILDRFTSQISYKDESELKGVRLYTAQPVAHGQVVYSFRNIPLDGYIR